MQLGAAYAGKPVSDAVEPVTGVSQHRLNDVAAFSADNLTDKEDTRMKAAAYKRNGEPDVLTFHDVADPEVGPTTVLIRVAYAALQGGDLINRRATHPPGDARTSRRRIGIGRGSRHRGGSFAMPPAGVMTSRSSSPTLPLPLRA